MPDQNPTNPIPTPTPTPAAVAPVSKFNLTKVLATIGVIAIVSIIVIGGVWILTAGTQTSSSSDDNSAVKVSTTSAKNASTSAVKTH